MTDRLEGAESTTKRKFGAAAIIGRFQPPHAAHLRLLKRALDLGDRVVIVLGSHRSPATIKNPWSSEQRQEMILSSLEEDLRPRILFAPVRDYLYNDDLWVIAVQQAVANALGPDYEGKIALVGVNKDKTCYYLNLFPQWDLTHVHVPQQESELMNASDIRNDLFIGGVHFQSRCPAGVAYSLMQFRDHNPEFERLRDEYYHVQDYKAAWAGAPYQPTFVTADAVVICAGHVLVVRRRGQPGKGSIALPGGFIRGDESVVEAALRELKEETGILYPKEELRACIKDRGVFDHPERSLRGRTITHAISIKLPNAPIPKVKGGDDADKAWWMPLADVFERAQEFFEDHVQIIHHFVSRS